MSAQLQLPYSTARWNDVVEKRQLKLSIHEYQSPSSASKINFEQFLLLQVIWNTNLSVAALVGSRDDSLVTPQHYNNAGEKLHRAGFWKSYLESLVTHRASALGKGAFPELGTFSIIRHYQVQCLKLEVNPDNISPKFTPIAHRTRNAFEMGQQSNSPSKGSGSTDEEKMTELVQKLDLEIPVTPSPGWKPRRLPVLSPAHHKVDLPAVKDEQIVNTALLLFLTAITMHFNVQADWSLHRERFVLGEGTKKIFEARVDGYLCSRGSIQVKAIIEVKPIARNKDLEGIRMQEGAQMAAWISSNPDENRKPKQKRLLISQDRATIYLTVARYNSEYVDYVANEQSAPGKAFLRMTEHGPFETANPEHMESLGCIVLAFALQECPNTSIT